MQTLSKRTASGSAAAILVAALAVALSGCGDPQPVATDRYRGPDQLFDVLESNIASSDFLEKIVDIDHSRLGAEAGSVMPPARVVIFSNPALDARLVAINPLIAVDLPLRALAYESVPEGAANITFNSFDYLRSRYGLGDLPELESLFDQSMSAALRGIEADAVSMFANDSMQPDGIITLESPFEFDTTVERLRAAILAQDDTVWFGDVDFQARAAAQGITIEPNRLLLFGGPAPGAKAMAEAPTLGLDAFCQKLLVWQDNDGTVRASYNDLLEIAERQGVSINVALRVINRRLSSTFESALAND